MSINLNFRLTWIKHGLTKRGSKWLMYDFSLLVYLYLLPAFLYSDLSWETHAPYQKSTKHESRYRKTTTLPAGMSIHPKPSLTTTNLTKPPKTLFKMSIIYILLSFFCIFYLHLCILSFCCNCKEIKAYFHFQLKY